MFDMAVEIFINCLNYNIYRNLNKLRPDKNDKQKLH